VRALSVRLITYFREWSLRRRIAGVAAAIIINALLLLMLLTLAPNVAGLKTDNGGMVTFNVEPPAPPSTEKKAVQRPTVHAEARTAPPPVPPPPPISPPTDLGLIQMSHDELSQVDSAMKAPPLQRSSQDSGQETRRASGSDTPTAGKGAHGETLYYAQWYREPTQAELRTYAPKMEPPEGAYGEIACRTVARYHVEDCYELSEAPAGYGLSRSVVNAAWQFLVLPPRLGGKMMVGEWVRIRITWVGERIRSH